MLAFLGKLILLILLATVIVPVGYLAWCAGQPMDLPQFKGLTYYQYLSWRKSALHQRAVEYRVAHPNAKMGGGLDACFNVDTIGDLGLKVPLAGFYSLAGVFPNLQNIVQKSDLQFVPKDVTSWTFLPDWWKIFESFV